MNHELPDVEAGFRKGRGTRDQIGNICCIIEKAREFQRNLYSASLTMLMPLTDLENSSKDGSIRLPYLPSEKPIFRSRSNS